MGFLSSRNSLNALSVFAAEEQQENLNRKANNGTFLVSYCSNCVGATETTELRGHYEVTLTSFENLLDFDMVGAEATVELEVVSVVQKGSAK